METGNLPMPFWAKIAIQVAVTLATIGGPVAYKAGQLEQRVETLQTNVTTMQADIKELLKRGR